jgi:2,4-dienoyl-CoA reductase-like NADH-dependent reductase (Old Yellow Enzyme family)
MPGQSSSGGSAVTVGNFMRVPRPGRRSHRERHGLEDATVMMGTMPALFEPLGLRGRRARNRIVVSPMCQYSARNGVANDWHLIHLGGFARGGAGIVLTEATAVEARGRISPEDLGLWNDDQVEPLARAVRFVQDHGALAGVQLAHAGRKASTFRPWAERRGAVPDTEGGWQVIGPTDEAFHREWPTPRPADVHDLEAVVAAFAAATRRADRAGFDVVEIHAAHGYLLHSFLSPLTNRRDDDYGGGFEGRTRIVGEVVTAVRQVWPSEKPLFVRVSATDWIDGGWTPDDTVRLAREIEPLGVDLVDCSSGGLVPGVKVPAEPGYQVPFAERVRREAGVPSGAVGLITEAEQAEAIVADGRADLVLLGREFLRHPHWPLDAARQLGVDDDTIWPRQYVRARLS